MVASRLILINETDSRPSVNSLHENFSGQSGRGVLHRGQAQNRPLLHVPRRPATESKGLGPLFLRREVAKRLGLQIVRSEVAANNVARRLGVAESAVTRYLDGSASLLDRWRIDRRKLFHYAAEEILGLAQRGNVLIKGWGAATLLRDVPQVISVRVCAPMDFRVRVMMERLGRNDADALREEIERFDAARAHTLRAYFNVDEEDARLYHIM